MKRFLAFVNFNRNERRGILVLLILLLTVIFFRYFIKMKQSSPQKMLSDAYTIIATKTIRKKKHTISNKVYKIEVQKDTNNPHFFIFDPNTADFKELLSLGFTYQNVQNIVKYRQYGGIFYSPTDLLYIYNIDTALVLLLSEFVSIDPETLSDNNKPKIDLSDNVHKTIPINTNDTSLLETIPGIGEVYALRIIKYGQLLGGYTNIEQLKEVYGIDERLYKTIAPYFIIDEKIINKISLNKADYKDLIRHPYINETQVKAIMKYRKLMGKFSSVNDLKDSYIYTADEFNKISPYLTVSN